MPFRVLAVDGDDQLVALVLDEALGPAGTFSSLATTKTAYAAPRSSQRSVQYLPGLRPRELAVLRVEGDLREARPRRGADLDHRVPLLAPGLPRLVADVMGDIAARAGDLVEQRVDPLLEVPALRRSA